MAPIQFTASMENNSSAASIGSAKCESSMSQKTSSSSVQSSQCQQTYTNASEQMSKSEKSSHVSDINLGSEIKLSSLSNNTSSVQSSTEDRNEANNNLNSLMKIQKRGKFFEDSFFGDVHEKFEKAVSEILEKSGQNSTLCDNMTSYRKLRQLDLKEENQAGTISYGERENKIVLDVQDFKQDNIEIKVVDTNTIQITGHVEKKTKNSVSTQSFHRQFTLPGKVDMTRATSNLSIDGILTIIVPRLDSKLMVNSQHDNALDSELRRNKEVHKCNSKDNKTSENFMKTTKSEDSSSCVISQDSYMGSTVNAQLSSSGSNITDDCSKENDRIGTNIKQPAQMTITKRGNFFEDTFFADVNDNFQKAVTEVLERWGEKSFMCDDMTSYRKLRQHVLKDENQAAAVSCGDKQHKIVLDVNDFKEGDINVKIIEDKTVQITGHIEKKNGNAISNQSFTRQFTLPDTVDMTLVTSSMSSDGILTVIIPRLSTKQLISNTNEDNQISKESDLNKEANQYSHENTLTTGKSMKYMKAHAQETETSNISQESNIESEIGTYLSSSNNNSTDVCSNDIESNLDMKRKVFSYENTAIAGKSMKTENSKSSLISKASNNKTAIEANLSSPNGNKADVCSEDLDTQGASKVLPESMPIQKRGNFFEDSFFADVHVNFQKAVTEVLNKYGETSSVSDAMTSYRNLRQCDMKEENQAATVSYGDKEHKIVLDVNDFREGDIKVKIIGDNTVQITGHIEKKNGNAISKESFHRQFTVPDTVDMTLVTSSMSSDGILTVIIPRLPTKQMVLNSKKDNQLCKDSYLNKEVNQYGHENKIKKGKSTNTMKVEEEKSSKILQESNVESRIGADLSSNSNIADICSEDKDSNLEKGINECNNENEIATRNSTKSVKTEKQMSPLFSEESDAKTEIEKDLSSSIINRADVYSEIKNINGASNKQSGSRIIKNIGNFFEDVFFADVHKSFQDAISEVLEKCGETSSVVDNMTSYRNLRQRDLKEENQAATVSYGDKEHKIILDVNNFKKDEIEVKIIEDNTVQITGHIEKKNGNAISTQSFHRQFTLPGTVDMTTVTSVMSSDGILTVIIPNVATEQVISNTKKDNICKESHLNKEENRYSIEGTITTGKSAKTMKVNELKSHVMSSSNSSSPDVLSGDKEYNLNKEINESSNENPAITGKSMKTEKSKSSLFSQESNTISGMETNLSSTNGNTAHTCSEDIDTQGTINDQQESMKIRKRGYFLEDSFFADVHEKFQNAVIEVLENYGETPSVNDAMTSYRNLRQRDLKEENQAATLSYGDKEHKIVVDVNDFKEGNIGVKIIGDNTVQISGHMEKKNGNAISTQSFNRQFTLPSTVDMALVTSNMSSDGILTVVVPRIATKPIVSNDKESNLNKEENEWSNEHKITTDKSMKANKEGESKSSVLSQGCNKSCESMKLIINSKSSVISQNSNTTNGTEAHIVSSNKKSKDVRSVDTNKEESNEINRNIFKNDEALKNEKMKASLDSEECDMNLNTQVQSSIFNKKASIKNSSEDNKNNLLIIKKRGKFFEDSFFEDVQGKFKKAVSEIMEKWGESSSLSDSMEAYRNHRQHNLHEENRAVNVSYGEKEHKIILDVHDFTKEDIKITAVKNTIQVTGHIENKNENAASTQSFHREFTLPGTVNIDSVTSSMSSDNILTITVPTITAQCINNTNELLKNRFDPGEILTANSEKQYSDNYQNESKYSKEATKHIQQTSSYNSSQNSSSTLNSTQNSSHGNSINQNTETSDLYSPMHLSIRRRGQLFQDSFFNDSQNQFDEAMKSILHDFENTDEVFGTELSGRRN